jgi:hypothetical protein
MPALTPGTPAGAQPGAPVPIGEGAPLPGAAMGAAGAGAAGAGAAGAGAAGAGAAGAGAAGAGAAAEAFGAAAAGAGAPSEALASGLGGALGAPQSALNMFGDLSPFRPPVPPEPPIRPGGQSRLQSSAIVPSVRTFKFADNQTPMPVNRFTFGFNFFDYVNQAVDKRLGIPLNRITAYRYVLGFEKTFLDQRASFGMRMPIENAQGASLFPGVGAPHTAVGDLAMYLKYALYMDRSTGRVLSGGMALAVPSGPHSFAGAPWNRGIHYTNLQPYLAFQWTFDRLYLIGFAAVNIPTSSGDVLMLYDDLSIGYFVYRNADPNAFLKSIAPTVEIHVNTPTNHRDIFNINDIAGTSEVVDTTQGVNFFFGKRTVLSLGVAEPLTGPKPFSIEALGLLNIFF